MKDLLKRWVKTLNKFTKKNIKLLQGDARTNNFLPSSSIQTDFVSSFMVYQHAFVIIFCFNQRYVVKLINLLSLKRLKGGSISKKICNLSNSKLT